MMDFDNILSLASQNQGSGSVKRYSLQAGPPKKDPRGKGVNPAAIQALLKKQHTETKIKEMQMKKKKEELLAKRVELKSHHKARAMASRTKDNFKGYNGIPVVDAPKKKRTKAEMQEERARMSSQGVDEDNFRCDTYDPDDEDNFEYEPTDSEPEPEPEPLRPGRSSSVAGNSGSSSSRSSTTKSAGASKPAPPPLNFADLLKLAEKKQHEPVDLKPKVVKKEERLRTAQELKELEMERRAKRPDKERDPRQEKTKPQPGPARKAPAEKEHKSSKPQKTSSERPSSSTPAARKSSLAPTAERGHVSNKSSVSEKHRTSQSDRDRTKPGPSGPAAASNGRLPPKAAPAQVPTKPGGPRPAGQAPRATSDLSAKRENPSSVRGRAGGAPGGQRPQQGGSQPSRPTQGGPVRQGGPAGGHKLTKGDAPRPTGGSGVKAGSNGVRPASHTPSRPTAGGPPRPGTQSGPRPGGSLQAKVSGGPQPRPGGSSVQGRPAGAGVGPGRPGNAGRPAGGVASGPGRPRCTVVSETISSKNVGGPRPGFPPRPGVPQRPGMPPRPGMGMPGRPMIRPPGTMLPPITSAYKRAYEDEEEEFDSEMEDFIDDELDEQEEVSKHIREIFGYDRTRYKDESDYALKFMESSWKDMQKEEARSLRLAVQEDLEEEKREEEEIKKKTAKRRKLN